MEQAMLDFLIQYHSTRDYYECHEILEDRWRLETDNDNKKMAFAALLQLAVGMYHYRRDNLSGASTLFIRTLDKLKLCHEEVDKLGVDVKQLETLVHSALVHISLGKPYVSRSIPLYPAALTAYTDYCQQQNLTPFADSPMGDDFLLNRHLKKGETHE